MAKSSSMSEVIFIFNKILLQMVFNFFDSEWILVMVIFIGGLALFYSLVVQDPYYNRYISTFHAIVNLNYFWSCVIILFLKIFKSYQFSAGLFILLVFIPIWTIICLRISEYRFRRGAMKSNRFEIAEQFIDYQRLFLILIENYKKSKDLYSLFLTYIENHADYCEDADCPLLSLDLKRAPEESMKKAVKAVFTEINSSFNQYIKRFKNNIKLRIAYAFFLIERMNNKKKALEELTIAESLNPSFGDEFLIYRYKKLIEDNLNDGNGTEGQSENEIDIVGLIAFETHLKMCTFFVKKASEFHLEFWNELLEEKPSLMKLDKLGRQVSLTVKNAKENWTKLIKINSNAPLILKFYSKFATHILNKKEKGRKLMDQFDSLIKKKYELRKRELLSLERIELVVPIALVLINQNQEASIKKVNKELGAILGYGPDELLNRRFEQILPQIYKEYYPLLLMSLINQYETDQSFSQLDSFFFCKKKNKSIVAIDLNIKIFTSPSLVNSVVFVHKLPINQNYSTRAILLTKSNGDITDISPESVFYFKLSFEIQQTTNLKRILPLGLVSNEYRKGKDEEINTKDGRQTCGCLVQSIFLDSGIKEENGTEFDNKRVYGFYAMFDFIKLTIKTKKTWEKNTYNLPLSPKKLSFDFYRPVEQSVESSQIRNMSDMKQQRRVSMVDDIKIARLWKGEVRELVEKQIVLDNESRPDLIFVNIEASVFKSYVEELGDKKKVSQLKPKNNIPLKILKNEKEKHFLVNFKFFALAWALVIIATSCFVIQILTTRLNLVNTNYNQISLMSNLSALFSNTYLLLLDYKLAAQNISNFNKTYVFSQLAQNSLLINDANNIIQAFPPDVINRIIQQYQNFKMKNYTYIIPDNGDLIIDNELSHFTTTFNQFIIFFQGLQSASNSIQDNFAQMNINFIKLFFYPFLNNEAKLGFNNFQTGLNGIVNSQSTGISIMVFLIVSSTAFCLYYYYLSKLIRKKTESILLMFLDIPRKDVEEIYKKCAKFMSFCNVIQKDIFFGKRN